MTVFPHSHVRRGSCPHEALACRRCLRDAHQRTVVIALAVVFALTVLAQLVVCGAFAFVVD